MATASKGDDVCLHISFEEEKALSIVLGAVGGDPSGMRGLTANINTALEEIGLGKCDIEAHSGSFIFTP